jgi:probable phosphoglycerate mutase
MTSKTPEETTLIGLLRHGETEWNTQKRIQGSGNSPLTPKGISQTREWAKTLQQWQWDQIHASDLGRVKQTVSVLNEDLQIPVFFDKRLREQHWGEWEGLTLSSIKTDHKIELERQIARGWEFTAPGGEARSNMRNRVFNCLEQIVTEAPGKKILVVCHMGIIKTILYHISNRDFRPEDFGFIKNNLFHIISGDEDGFKLECLNISRQSNR